MLTKVGDQQVCQQETSSNGRQPPPPPPPGEGWLVFVGTDIATDRLEKTYHTLLPDDRHPVLHPVHSVGDLGEVVLPQRLLAHREGAVVRPGEAQVITDQWEDGQVEDIVDQR